MDFAIIRVAYRGYGAAGNMNEDNCFVKHIEGAKAAGVMVGIYFFSQALNTLLTRVFTEKDKSQLPDHFRELIGHTPLQVACGGVLGVAVALLLHLIPVFRG